MVTLWCIRGTCWITKVTCTYAHALTGQYVVLFDSNNGFMNAPHDFQQDRASAHTANSFLLCVERERESVCVW
jgi:hypothetical protein